MVACCIVSCYPLALLISATDVLHARSVSSLSLLSMSVPVLSSSLFVSCVWFPFVVGGADARVVDLDGVSAARDQGLLLRNASRLALRVSLACLRLVAYRRFLRLLCMLTSHDSAAPRRRASSVIVHHLSACLQPLRCERASLKSTSEWAGSVREERLPALKDKSANETMKALRYFEGGEQVHYLLSIRRQLGGAPRPGPRRGPPRRRSPCRWPPGPVYYHDYY